MPPFCRRKLNANASRRYNGMNSKTAYKNAGALKGRPYVFIYTVLHGACRRLYAFIYAHYAAYGLSDGPLAVFEDHGFAVFALTCDFCAGGAYHKVHMHHGTVYSRCGYLIVIHALAALNGVVKAEAQRQMAGGVLIVKSVVEQHS